jgi:hypothetical protein
MAGKKKSNKVKTSGWGGYREGAGRKRIKIEYDGDFKERLWQAAQKLEKKYGESVEKVILRMIYSDDVSPRVKVRIARIYSDILVIPEIKKTFRHESLKPAVCLPKELEDPAEIIQKKPNKLIPIDQKK